MASRARRSRRRSPRAASSPGACACTTPTDWSTSRVSRRPRPPLSLWALNRLAHEQPGLIEAFLEAAEQLREAYRSGGDIRAATPPLREAEARVLADASELLRTHGKSPTESVLRGLGSTLS